MQDHDVDNETRGAPPGDGAARPQEVVDLVAGRAGCAPVMHRLTRIAVSYEGLPRDTESGGEE